MRKYQRRWTHWAGGAVLIVTRRDFGRTHELREEGEHQRGFGHVGVPVLCIGKEFGAHALTYLGDVADVCHGVVPSATDDLQCATERGGIADVPVDQQ